MKKTTVMGILNVTPDSFSDGGKYVTLDAAVWKAEEMIKEGADILDIGGESSRPGAEKISIEEELNRVIPVLKAVRTKIGKKVLVSVDTYKSEVAEEALKAGANIINSLGGFSFDENLVKVAARYKCPVILYHIKGTPETMQKGEIRYDDVVADILHFFDQQIKIASLHGVKKEKLILDPGIGFGKTLEQNVEIIKRLKEFKVLNLPILIGVSRKSHLATILKTELKLSELPSTGQRLEAGLAETAVAVLNGASIVRTHDVLETKKFLTVIDLLKK